MSLSCYIVDDEPAAVESLATLIRLYYPALQVKGSAGHVNEAAAWLNNETVDILFLDIRMQGETGFDLLKQLRNHHFHLIFVTAYDEYGIQAIKFSATDYLLKPVSATELIAAIHKVGTQKLNQQEQFQMLLQSHMQQEKHQQKRIALASQNEIKYVLITDIVCCKAENSYTVFYLDNGKQGVVVSRPISEYETLLEPYGFIRVHQSWLINSNKMEIFKKEDGGYLLMENNMEVPVSRQRRHLLKDL